ncbi:type II secretion system protein GspG [Klebsiella pneumoniae subsp. pneumoniae]|nr:type II secretion system protein GspG [Klebsiella pneumoniae subsp. pneumoniae]
MVSDLVALEGALDMYKLDNSRYPQHRTGTAGAGDRSGRRAACPATTRKAAISAVCRRTVGNEYQLLSPGQHGAIDVFSVGPDGMPDTNDDIGNWTLGKK